MATIRRAVIPAAGLGSRLLPLTKAIPKEMLPVGDRPVIEHTVRELIDSGITDIAIVVSGNKGLIQEHFRPDPQLVDQLRAEGKDDFADAVADVADLSRRGHITYLFQHGPYGNGTPVLNAARYFGEEPMLVLWPDDVFVAEVPRAQQLIRAFERTECPVLALMPLEDPAESRRYGVPVVQEHLEDGLMRISGLVEKPEPAKAPSAFAAIGGYVVTPCVIDALSEQTRIFDELSTTDVHPLPEIYLTDAINACAREQDVYGQVIKGRWYDTGNQAGYLKAQFASAFADPDHRDELLALADHYSETSADPSTPASSR